MHRDISDEIQQRSARRRAFGGDILAEWGGGMRRGGGGHRMRRGDIRTALLVALSDGPGHGYELSSRLEEKSGGSWRPSPGSVYPTLQLFEDAGLVKAVEVDGKRIYNLTDAGRAEATARIEQHGGAPWESGSETEAPGKALRKAVGQWAMAFKQVAQTADPALIERAVTIIRGATRELYQLLSED